MTSVKAIRWIDHWVGLPLCFILTGVQRHEPAPPVRRILFVKLVEQGSTVRACFAIRRAIELVGRDNVYFLVFEVNSQRLVNGEDRVRRLRVRS